MKKIIKTSFPWCYGVLKRLYNSTPYYIKRINKVKGSTNIRITEENKILTEIFEDQCIVRNGPFKGMQYIKRSSGSALLPKILGSYEEPIQEWICEVIEAKKCSNILDIGCAEGYYAVGFAMRMPDTHITAYDIDEEAIRNINELAIANHIINIEIKAECTHEELNSKCGANTLVFCDVEGFEEILLDPVKAPNLKYADIIVESHDFIVPNITNELIDRFYMTHTIRIRVDYPGRFKEYNTPKKATNEQYRRIINELRPKKMKWIYLKSINAKI